MNSSIRHQQGAVLLAVIVIVMVITVLLTGANQLMSARIKVAGSSQALLQEKAAAFGQLNKLKYLYATERLTPKGLSSGTTDLSQQREDGMWITVFTGDEYRLDSFEYVATINNVEVRFAIQDESGLIPFNSGDQFWLKQWLTGLDMDFITVTTLADKLADYADADDWSRPGGAEKNVYASAGMPPPPNYLLQQCSEIKHIIGWEDALDINMEIEPVCSLRRTPTLNVNSVPLTLWQTLWPERAEAVMQARAAERWAQNATEALMLLPELASTEEDYYTVFPRGGIRVRITTPHLAISGRLVRGNKDAFPVRWYAAPNVNRVIR